MRYSKAALASSLVAIIVTLALMLISSGGRLYMSTIDWQKVESMNYEEGREYLAERSKTMSRWESLMNGVSYSQFWYSAFVYWIIYFSIGFSSCIVFIKFLN